MKIVIIGLGSAGMSAALAAIRNDPKSEITIIERRSYDMFSPCGIPFVFEGCVKSFESLKHDFKAESMGMKKLLEHEVQEIDREKKIVKVWNMKDNSNLEQGYDSLIIATGSEAFIPPVKGLDSLIGSGVFTLGSLEIAAQLREHIKDMGSISIIVGGGAIGLELAAALQQHKIDTTLIEMKNSLLPNALDPDMAKMVEEYLGTIGVRMRLGARLESVTAGIGDSGNQVLRSIRVSGEEFNPSALVLASGVRANTELAAEAGLNIEKGIVTDERMHSAEGIYAAGDCAQSFSAIDRRPSMVQTATTAIQQGRVAGINASGGNAVYPGNCATFVSRIGDLEVASTGFTSEGANSIPEKQYSLASVRLAGNDKPEWIQGSGRITIKLIFDTATGKVIGAQAIGASAATHINVVSTALLAGMTVMQLADVQLAYCPRVSEAYDILTRTAELAIRMCSSSSQGHQAGQGMMQRIDYKEAGGKLLRLSFDVREGIVREVQINGDFFVHPEEGVALMEEALRGKKAEYNSILSILNNVVRDKNLTLIGLNTETISRLISKTLNSD